MPGVDLLNQQRKQISDRLRELRPLHEEYLTLERALEALESVEKGPTAPARGRRPGPGRPRAAVRRGRRRRGGTRAEQALALIKQNPGITIPDMAKRLGIKQNYLYRVTAGLVDGGEARREGRGFHTV